VPISSSSLAISSVYKIKELTLMYKDLRNIVLIVKKLLQKHDMNRSYHGGLNSYSIVLMASTFI
jgi:DNA polymerase sigma